MKMYVGDGIPCIPMPARLTKRANRHYKAKNREANLAARAEANKERSLKGGPGWRGIANPPAPYKPNWR